MSQQPPFGEPQNPQYPQQPPQYPQHPQHPQQPPQGQQPGYSPYGQYPPNPYGGGQQQKSNTTRNVLVIVTVLVVLFCGGVIGFGIWAFNNIEDGIDNAFDTEYRGSEDDPIEVAEGDSFSIRGFDYAEGWSIVEDDPSIDTFAIDNLKVTNNRDDEESNSLSIVFSFYSGGEGVGDVNCSSDTSVRHEKTVRMTCNGYDLPPDFDSIEVHDTALYE